MEKLECFFMSQKEKSIGATIWFGDQIFFLYKLSLRGRTANFFRSYLPIFVKLKAVERFRKLPDNSLERRKKKKFHFSFEHMVQHTETDHMFASSHKLPPFGMSTSPHHFPAMLASLS